MKYLISNLQKQILLSLLVFTSTIYLACNKQSNVNQLSIAPLKSIEQTPKAHYKTLSAYSKDATEDRQQLDSISFPYKAHQLTIKIISPAYLNHPEIDELIMQLKPPANSSKQTKASLNFLLELQETRTPEQVNEALQKHDIAYFPLIGMRNQKHLFFEAYEIFDNESSSFDHSLYPKTKHLLNNIMKEMRITEFTAKNHFLRARPRQLEPKLKPLKKMKTSSFASGHTLWAYMQAYIMGALIPEKRDEFITLAYEIGFSREVLGVHYPSDEEASRKLAHQLLQKMWNKPAFIKDFHDAKLEWADW